MIKKYIVSLTDEEKTILLESLKKLVGSSQKVKRAHILLHADVNSHNWKDLKIAQTFHCQIRTVENVRKLFVTEGFERSFNGKQRDHPPRAPKLNSTQEARVIAMRLGDPPKGFSGWSLRLLADMIVELEIVDSIAPNTVRKILKKMG